LYEKSAEIVFRDAIHDLIKKNLLQADGIRLKLTEYGLLFGNEVFSKFLS
jgi:coproporphyrinogen III oxidase-like Fe-S oxidoreductase